MTEVEMSLYGYEITLADMAKEMDASSDDYEHICERCEAELNSEIDDDNCRGVYFTCPKCGFVN